jgi:hypothetical protein
MRDEDAYRIESENEKMREALIKIARMGLRRKMVKNPLDAEDYYEDFTIGEMAEIIEFLGHTASDAIPE